jgi:hypothetical protein
MARKSGKKQGKINAKYANLTSRPMRLPTGKLLNACKGMTKDIRQNATKNVCIYCVQVI